MPGTGDVIYVLGPSLVALALGVVILVLVRALRRGPAVAPRSAPHHGLQQQTSEAGSGSGAHKRPTVPAQRSAEDWGTVTRAADGRRLAVRPPETVRAQALARRAFTRR